MKWIFILFNVLIVSQLRGQVYSEDFSSIIAENQKCKINIDTLKVDTTIYYRIWEGCILKPIEVKDTTSYKNIIKEISLYTYSKPKKGLNILLNKIGKRESIGFLKTKFILSYKWPFIHKYYYKVGLWVLYRNGHYYRTESHRYRGGKQSFLQLHENGFIYILRLADKKNAYTEFYNENGELIETEEQMVELEERLRKQL